MSALQFESNVDTQLVNLKGPLSAAQAAEIVQLFNDLSERGARQVVVNLEDVPLMDSRGLLALVHGFRVFGDDPRRFRLAAPQEQPQLLLRVCRMDQVFEFVEPASA